MNPNQNLEFNYTNSPLSPAAYQKQQIQNSTDPMNIYIGNPKLKQGFQHKFDLSFKKINAKSNEILIMDLTAKLNSNVVAANSTIDSFNRTITQYINLNGNYNIYANTNYTLNTKNHIFRFSFSPQFAFDQNRNIINGIKNTNKNTSVRMYSAAFVNIGKTNGFLFEVNGAVSLNNNSSSLTSDEDSYLNQEYKLGIYKTVLKRLDISTDYNLVTNPGNISTKSSSYLICNTALSLSLLKHSQLLLGLQANDIFNENTNYNRFTNDYTLTEQYFSSQKRYFMLRVYYKFANKIGKTEAVY